MRVSATRTASAPNRPVIQRTPLVQATQLVVQMIQSVVQAIQRVGQADSEPAPYTAIDAAM